jgi:hypothetical protein
MEDQRGVLSALFDALVAAPGILGQGLHHAVTHKHSHGFAGEGCCKMPN